MGLVARNQTLVYRAWHGVSGLLDASGVTGTWAVALLSAVLVLGALWAASSRMQAVLCEQEGGLVAHKHNECHAGNHPNRADDMRCFLQGC